MARGNLFHNLTTTRHHVPPPVDLSAAATMYNVMASGVLGHKEGRRHHDCCNSCVDLGAAATLRNAMILCLAVTIFTTQLLQGTMLLLLLILALLLPHTMSWLGVCFVTGRGGGSIMFVITVVLILVLLLPCTMQ
jgi:hypothetical protein